MFKLELNQHQLNVIGAGLGELPYKVAAPVVEVLNRQLADTVQPDTDDMKSQSEDRKDDFAPVEK